MSGAELAARRTAAAAVLGDYRAEVASAPLSRPPGREWMLRLAGALGDLLEVLSGPGAWLDRDQAATVLAALEDATQGIRERAASCPVCAEHPAGLCDEHEADLDRVDAYRQLAREIGGET